MKSLRSWSEGFGAELGAGAVTPPLLASYVVQPVSIAAQVTPAPTSSARRLCAGAGRGDIVESPVSVIA